MKASLTLVLGVHRSGTSLLTNALVTAGALAGKFKDTRDADNPDGYAEHPEVRGFNDRLLAHLGASWDNWGFRASTIDFDADLFSPWREEAVGILRAAFDGPGPFVLKDPRIASLLAFWEGVIPDAGFQLRRIIILRDPAEVAESQRQRVERGLHAFHVIARPESMAALWAVIMLEVLNAIPDDSTLLVRHADIISDPETTLAAVAAFSGLEADEVQIAELARGVVKPGLYRASAKANVETDGVWMTAARGLFDDLTRGPTPRCLTAEEARLVAQRQQGIAILLPGLSAVRESINRMNVVLSEYRARVEGLERFLWAVAPLAASSSKSNAAGTIDQAVAVIDNTPLPYTSLSAVHTLSRLLVRSGRAADAKELLDRVRPRFGNAQVFRDLEEACRQISSTDGVYPSA